MFDTSGQTPAPRRVAKARIASADDRPGRLKRLSAAALVVLGLGSATALGEGTVRSNLAAMVQSASELIAQRSPGVRTRAVMGKGKGKFDGKEVRLARALPRVRDARGMEAPPAAAAPAPFAEVLPEAAPAAAAPVVAAAAPGIAPGPGDGWFLFTPVPGPGIIGGGPGGGIVVTPPGEEEPELPPPPPPAVPEPASWAMMLLGFGALGFTMRRKRHGRSLAA
jgi:hypothetical protein